MEECNCIVFAPTCWQREVASNRQGIAYNNSGKFWLQEGTEREREIMVLWKITNRFFPFPCASGQPKQIGEAGLRDKRQ